MSAPVRNLLSALACVCLAGSIPSPAAPATTCVETSVASDTAATYNVLDTFMGASLGQTFVTAASAITSITVWTTPSASTDPIAWRLFLTALDATGTPQFGSPLLDEARTVQPPADADHPRACVFAFDPPFDLPGPGTYYLAFKPGDCSGTRWLLGAPNLFPGGTCWASTTRHFGCNLPSATPLAGEDLRFEIRFCAQATASPGSTWGSVKAMYRQ